jgi:tetratricopeptide (TPR) repeat protein
LHDALSVADGLTDLGAISMLSGDAAGAQKHLGEALAIFRTLDDAHAVATVSTNLGRAYQLSGDFALAIPALSEALSLAREVGARDSEALALYALGMIAHDGGDHPEAGSHLRASLDVAYHANELWLVAEILEGLGQVAVASGDADGALRLFGRAMAMREESGSEMPAAERERYERSLATAREQTGPERAEMLFDEGRAASLETTVDALLVTAPGHTPGS